MSHSKIAKNAAFAALTQARASALSTDIDAVSTLNAAESLAHAVKRLKNRHVLSAPVVNDKGSLVGVLDMNDTLSFLVHEATASSANVASVAHHPVSAAMQYSARDVFAPCAPSDVASELIELLAVGIHRVPLVNEANKLVGLVTQVDVARKLVDVLAADPAGELGHRSLASLGLGAVQPVTAWASQSVKTTIEQLDEFQVQALALTDDNGVLVGNFSVSNLVELFTAHDRTDSALSAQAYLLKHSPASLTPLTAKPSDSLVAATKKMLDNQIHRLWIVDENNKPTGVFTFTDFCRAVRDEVDEAFQKRVAGTGAASTGGSGAGVLFRTAQGHALSLNDAGSDLILRPAADERSVFQLDTQSDGAHVALRTSNGKLVAVDDKLHVTLLSPAGAVPSNAQWQVVLGETGFVSLRAHNGGFLEHVVGNDDLHTHQFKVSAKAARATKKQMFKKSSTK